MNQANRQPEIPAGVVCGKNAAGAGLPDAGQKKTNTINIT